MPAGYHTVSTQNPEQQAGFSQLMQQLLQQLQGTQNLFGQGSSFLQNLLSGSPESTQAFEAPIMRQFNEQIIPGIAERFTGMGAGAQRSGAFQRALSGAGTGLAENLAALRGNMQLQALPQALGYSQQPLSGLENLLGMNTQAFLEKQTPWWQSALTSLAGGAGSALGMAATGGLSGILGGVGGLFGPKQQGSTINNRGQITGKFG